MPLFIVPILIALDQVLKLAAIQQLSSGSKTLIPGLLDLTLVYNTGAAFGLFTGGAQWLSSISVLVGLGILYYLYRNPRLSRVQTLALSMIAAGAWGNAIDRIGRGSVVDYLDMTTNIAPIRDFPIFNLADMCVVIGVFLLLLPQRRRKW
jgi:signal peptidase II